MPSITINGMENITNKKFDNVIVNGAAIFPDGFQALRVQVDGTVRCNGDFVCESIRCNGSSRFFGGMDIKELYCEGSLISSGTQPVKIGQIYCNGATKFFSDILTDTIDISGSLNTEKDCNLTAQKIFCDGSIIVNGDINADMLNADGYIFANTINSKKVYINSQPGRKLKKLLTRKPDTAISLISADEIELINVKASKVVGKNIKIGSGCVIESVECSGELSIDENAVVSEILGDYQKA
ncbi:MAG: hypothetical protein PUG48_04625 [Clostridia bacterium]|nr:hypothetical protein [Clostridia bacterium]